MISIVLLALGVLGAVVCPWGLPAWASPTAAAGVAVALGSVPRPGHVLGELRDPIAFLVLAVPLAVLLDRVGFFRSAAALMGQGRHLVLGLWVLGALVTTVLNLDASVVLLTPLYVRIAKRSGIDPFALAVQPVLLSCLASSALPVSNLTNLIVSADRQLSATSFLAHLGPPSLAAVTIGWFMYRVVVKPERPTVSEPSQIDRRSLLIGGCVVVFLLVGFVVGPSIGVAEWAVALVADLALIVVTRGVPVREVPWGTALVAGSLGLLAAGAAAHISLDPTFGGGSNLDLVRVAVAATVGANVVNNLPALLVALPHTTTGVWALLLGVNIGPMVLITGTLASLLWQASLARLGVVVSARRFAHVGVRVMVPSLAGALAVLLVLRPVVGS